MRSRKGKRDRRSRISKIANEDKVKKSFKLNKVQIVAIIMIVTGLSVIGYDFFTDSKAYEATKILAEITEYNQVAPVISDIEDVDSYQVSELIIEVLTEDQKTEQVSNMKSVIEIPDLDICAYIYDNVDDESLDYGVGWYPNTAVIGEDGNTVIAGHSSSVYSSVFNGIETMEKYDEFYVYTEQGEKLTYYVTSIYTVNADAMWVLDAKDLEYSQVNLLTCTHDGVDRLIVEGCNFTPAQLLEYQSTEREAKLDTLQSINAGIDVVEIVDYFANVGVVKSEIYYLEDLKSEIITRLDTIDSLYINQIGGLRGNAHLYNEYFNTTISLLDYIDLEGVE